jgi:hypothetical protein
MQDFKFGSTKSVESARAGKFSTVKVYATRTYNPNANDARYKPITSGEERPAASNSKNS